ncbi:MAG: PIG-L family deacetylase [Chitinophagales bacterium]|nr:PIG-L family deacetylase [Chitinophagales bacterium]HRP38605.1 PIG-L family deacetylase [Chitinophagales bacterium]
MDKIKLYTFISFLVLGSISNAQPNSNSSNIFHQIQSLPVCGSVLYFAAHPDDENTRLISYLTNELHLRTGYLSLTRGDGGQNLIGNEQAEALGLIRTNELLQARKIDGAQQFFSRAFDFGFSKNPEETFQFWDKEKVLADAVWVIRNFQPDVIICRFPTTGEGGHGHHTASAIIAEEAFKAAADPKQFPEQLKYVSTWQAKRLLWNTFNFGGRNTTSPNQFKINVGEYNALLGKSYGEIAAESRSKHSSQAFGTAKNRDNQFEFFKTILGDAPKETLTDNVDITFNRFGNSSLQDLASSIVSNYDFKNPSKSVSALVNLYTQIEQNKAMSKVWQHEKLEQIKQLIIECSGLYMEAICTKQFAAIDDTLKVTTNLVNRSNEKIVYKNFFAAGANILQDSVLPLNQTVTSSNVLLVNKTTDLSQPYWLKEPRTLGMFVVNNQTLIGKAINNPALSVPVTLNINGTNFNFELPVQYKKVEPSKGEVYEPLYIVPPATANFSQEVFVTTAIKKEVSVTVKAFIKNASGTLELVLPAGWIADKNNEQFSLKNEGDEKVFKFTLQSTSNKITDSIFTIGATLVMNGNKYNNSFTEIKYDHIPYLILLNASAAKLATINLKNTSLNVGYIAGAGDKIPQLLKETGVKVTELNSAEFHKIDLKKYDAIITGVRAYNTDAHLKNIYPELMRYVESGGKLLVQYNTSMNLLTNEIGPFPFTISRDRVTDENSEVKFTNPKDSLLNFPNKITENDFLHWIQERGLYFPANLDKQYKTVISMHDKGESALDNSIIYCNYGKGKFVYTGLSFFRELPAGVPGAFRLFSNLMAKP